MNEKDKKILSNNLKRIMNNKNISRRQISKDLNIGYSTLSNWVSGNKYPRRNRIIQLSNYLNISEASLIGDNNNTVLDSIYKVASQYDYNKQLQILNDIKGNDKKASSNIDLQIINNINQLNTDQKNKVLGFMAALIEK